MQNAPASAPPRPLARWAPLLLAALLLAADQALKAWALANLRPGEGPFSVVPGVFGWYLTFNTGAAWSLLSGGALPLAILRLAVGFGILVYVWRRPPDRYTAAVLGIIAAGAMGNAIDGLIRGQVTDMIYSPALSSVTRALGAGSFPIFNIADSCVVVGVILLLLGSLLARPRRA